ncbi:hypothetical protein JTE90_012621 [Oedothorax gibbosus]|uniref:DUF7041 domain-containing protein n=1 Tax=Oedothorax gibbosus TaxID=931172 RepID=A0AAV6UK78_9ARAC|nr:hypothetical protein JTE90_012621 [Oedothorax gibbosus]
MPSPVQNQPPLYQTTSPQNPPRRTSQQPARVSVKAPPFWRKNSEIWFQQIESQFELANITAELTKFHRVVPALQPEELSIVGVDLIITPAPVTPYTAIRNRLCAQYADTEDERLRELISGLQLGDKKPSRLLLDMKSKAGTDQRDPAEVTASPAPSQPRSADFSNFNGNVGQRGDISAPDAAGDFVQAESVGSTPPLHVKMTRKAERSPAICKPPSSQLAILLVPPSFRKKKSLKLQTTVFLGAGKLREPSLNPVGDGRAEMFRLYIKDKSTAAQYLIDTGVDVSVSSDTSHGCRETSPSRQTSVVCSKQNTYLNLWLKTLTAGFGFTP